MNDARKPIDCLSQQAVNNRLLLLLCLCFGLPVRASDLISTRPPGLSIGVKQVLVIRVDFSDLPDSKHLVSTLQSVMDTQVRPKFQQSSYGLVDIVSTISAVRYRMPRTASYYATTADRRGLMEDAVAAASADYAVANYEPAYGGVSSIGQHP